MRGASVESNTVLPVRSASPTYGRNLLSGVLRLARIVTVVAGVRRQSRPVYGVHSELELDVYKRQSGTRCHQKQQNQLVGCLRWGWQAGFEAVTASATGQQKKAMAKTQR